MRMRLHLITGEILSVPPVNNDLTNKILEDEATWRELFADEDAVFTITLENGIKFIPIRNVLYFEATYES
jgi:hypothetical protein